MGQTASVLAVADESVMWSLRTIARGIDGLNEAVGRSLTWLMPIIVLVAASVVVLRYAFGIGLPWLTESFIWLHGMVFTVGAGYVLLHDKHVRVDLFYGRLSARARAVVNIVGVCLFLWPAMAVITWTSLPVVTRSWNRLEASPTMDGLPFMYLLKSCLLLFCVVMALQGLSLVLGGVATLAGRRGDSDA
ncbi:TRAP transporter small permease subunit [Rhodospirillaceae bacterium SYSU D60014]|uniref:TRAP transporter small permease subunit n=1 Tax=Virgifigura deserti TaxID=2268457 RepID=UPI0013C3E6D6